MKIGKLIISAALAISVSGCAGLQGNEQIKANSATIINFKQDSDSGTQVAQLMCFKRHLAPYTEIDRNLAPAAHDIYIRVIDYSYMNPALRNRTQWGGTVKKGSYLILKAPLTAGQIVTIQRRDKDGKSYIWLQDKLTGKAMTDTVYTILQSRFNIDSDYLDKECAKGTV
jgi:hypothetical protein